jgi:hypothetical protein
MKSIRHSSRTGATNLIVKGSICKRILRCQVTQHGITKRENSNCAAESQSKVVRNG